MTGFVHHSKLVNYIFRFLDLKGNIKGATITSFEEVGLVYELQAIDDVFC